MNPHALNRTGWRFAAWAGIVLMLMAILFVSVSQERAGAWTIGFFLLASMAFLLANERIPSAFGFLFVMASVLNAGGWALGWYRFGWFDEFIHPFTAFAGLSSLGFLRASAEPAHARSGSIWLVWWCAAVGLGLGILWEIAEAFFLDLRFGDTALDLVLDTLGSALGGALALWAFRAQRQGPATSPILPAGKGRS